MNARFQDFGIDARMMALHVPAPALASFWALLRPSDSFLGCSITYPHKQAAFDAVDTMTPRAKRLGAINTIRRETEGTLVGDATDGLAAVEALRAAGFEMRGGTAAIVGAGGGAGQAIADALCCAGLRRLTLLERDPERLARAQVLVRSHGQTELSDRIEGASLLINATTLGKSPQDPLPFKQSDLAASQAVLDIVSGEGRSALLTHATGLGCLAVNGNDMGAAQVSAQLSHLGLL